MANTNNDPLRSGVFGGLLNAFGNVATGVGNSVLPAFSTVIGAGGDKTQPRPQVAPAKGQQAAGNMGQNFGPQDWQAWLRGGSNQQQQPRPSYNYNTNIDPNYGALLGAGALSAQNRAVNSAYAGANNAVVGGGLTGVSPNSAQAPSFYTNQMNQQAHANGNVRRGMATSDYFFDKDGVWRMFDYRRDSATPEIADQLMAGNPYGVTGTDGTPLGTGGSGSGGSGSGGPLGSMQDEYQKKLDEANAENEKRYQQGLKELTDLRSRSQYDVNRRGAQEARDIRKDAKKAGASQYQQAVRSGMANSTVPAVMQRGVDRSKTDAIRRLGDSVSSQRLGTDQTLTNNIAQWIANKENQAPDWNQMLELAKLYGASGYGQPMNLAGAQAGGLDLSGLAAMFGGGGGWAPPQAGQAGGFRPGVNGGGMGNFVMQGNNGGANGNGGGFGGISNQGMNPLLSLAQYYGTPYAASGMGGGIGSLFSSPGSAIGQGVGGLAGLIQSGIGGLSSGLSGLSQFFGSGNKNGLGGIADMVESMQSGGSPMDPQLLSEWLQGLYYDN